MGSPSTLLSVRLRRRRGVWALAMFALLFKVFAATICLVDGTSLRVASDGTLSACVGLTMGVAADRAVSNDGDGTCLLAEAGGCHCACAHTVPLPSMLAFSVEMPTPHFTPILPDSPFIPASVGSLLRPPIA